LALLDETIPTLEETLDWLDSAAAGFASIGRPWTLKGMPTCVAPRFQPQMRATPNRYYVSAIHQGADAETYLEDRLGVGYTPACAGCAARGQCDGAWLGHVRTGRMPPPSALAP
jgi:hypothetical protein